METNITTAVLVIGQFMVWAGIRAQHESFGWLLLLCKHTLHAQSTSCYACISEQQAYCAMRNLPDSSITQHPTRFLQGD
jgi:hypothetical protein